MIDPPGDGRRNGLVRDHDRSRANFNVRFARGSDHAVFTAIDPGKWRESAPPYGWVTGAGGVAGCVVACVLGWVVAGSLATAAA